MTIAFTIKVDVILGDHFEFARKELGLASSCTIGFALSISIIVLTGHSSKFYTYPFSAWFLHRQEHFYKYVFAHQEDVSSKQKPAPCNACFSQDDCSKQLFCC